MRIQPKSNMWYNTEYYALKNFQYTGLSRTIIMKENSEVKRTIYKPLKWIEDSKRHPVVNRYLGDNLIQSITNPEKIQRTIRRNFLLQLNGQNFGFTYIDPKEKEYKEKEDKENVVRENRQKIFNQHDRLLSENQPWEKQSEAFKVFYSQYEELFEKIQILGDRFKNEESLLGNINLELQLKYISMERAASRKEGFFANIKFHLKHADQNWHRLDENRIRSMAIAVQTPLGIAFMLLGAVILIPTIGTFLLYLPIAIIALGAILTITALVLAYVDQHEAINTHQALENSISDLLTEQEKHTSCLLETWKEIETIDFEPINLSMA